MARLLVPFVAALLALFVLACGGGDDESTNGAPAPSEGGGGGVPPPSSDGSPTASSGDAPAAGDVGPGSAVVTIGDMRYEFGAPFGEIVPPGLPLCNTVDADGTISGLGYTADFSTNVSAPAGAALHFRIRPNSYQDPNPGQVDLDEPYLNLLDTTNNIEWYAGFDGGGIPGVTPEQSRVVESDLNDQQASGAALFIQGA